MNPSSSQLKLTDYPVFVWLGGGIFLFTGIAIAAGGKELVLGIVFGAIGLFILLGIGGINQCLADKTRGTLTIKNGGLLGGPAREFPLRDVTAVEVESSRGNRGGEIYRVGLLLASGERIPLTTYYSSGLGGKEKTARRLRDFLGLSDGVTPVPVVQNAISHRRQTGSTDGVTWQLEMLTSPGNAAVTRWFADAAKFPDQFLMLVQSAGGSATAGLMASVAQFAYAQYPRLLQLDLDETPGIENASPLDDLDPRLSQHYAAITSDPFGARNLLNPWAVTPLTEWAERHPTHTFQMVSKGQFGPLIVLFSPKGLWLAFLSAIDDPAQVEAVAQLGAALTRALGTSR